MPPLPPAELVLDSLRLAVLPAAGGAALVMCLFLLLGRWAAAVGSAAAVVVGFAWANYTFTAATWDATARLVPWKPGQPAWHQLPRAALVLVAVGLVSRWAGLLAGLQVSERRWWVKNLFVWLPRWAAVVVVSGWVIPTQAADWPWVRPVLTVVMLLTWVALDGIARDGAGAQVAAYQSLIFLAAAVVLIHHHWTGAMEIAVVLACAMFGVAAAAGVVRADTSGAIPASVGFLPALLLNGRVQVDSQVPLVSFWLVGLAPLVFTPFLIPRVARQNRWLLAAARLVLLLVPLLLAVGIAAEHEKLPFEDEVG